jgi:hypothetical protein
MHQAWLDIIELNALNKNSKNQNLERKKNMFIGINQNEEVLLVQVNHGYE